MLLAQINRDSPGMAEFHDADGQPVTLCLTEAVTVGGEILNINSSIYCYQISLEVDNWHIYFYFKRTFGCFNLQLLTK